MSRAADTAQPDDEQSTQSDLQKESEPTNDLEGQEALEPKAENVSAFKALGWLDRFLAIWILLAIVVGILIGNFVEGAEEALQNGKFVGVSVPIGKLSQSLS